MNVRKRVLILALASGAMLSYAADETDFFTIGLNEDGLDYLGYPTNAIAAEEKGRTNARQDVSKGIFRIPTYGLPGPSFDDYFRLLEKRFGIQRQILGGCVVSDGLASYAKGYSEVSVAAICARFGTNVLETAWRQAQHAYGEPSIGTMPPIARHLETHRVKPGESLSSIAKQYRVSLNALIDVNPRVSRNRLQINQILMLPPRTPTN